MILSSFGTKLTQKTGILELMDDLGRAMKTEGEMTMLGGGNPAPIPGMEAVWRGRMQQIMHSEREMENMLGNYDTPQGNPEFIQVLARFFRDTYGWEVTERNITITNGSQSAFFYLFNLLAGRMPDGSFRKILFPLTPEYIGYADQGIERGMFTSVRPEIERLGKHSFKYHVDFDHLEITQDIAAICVSRPTNPTGNVLSDDEVEHLAQLAREHRIPLIVDNAYGVPFPGIVFAEATPRWDKNRILAMSLSKLGLPSSRTGIIVASEPMIEAIGAVNAIASLATGGIGQVITQPLIESGEIIRLGQEVVRPFYESRMQHAMQVIEQAFDPALPYRVHVCEGALFLWMWFEGLPISSRELYDRLKSRGVIVVPGEYFFPGLEDDDWTHKSECIRVNYARESAEIERGMRVIAEEVGKAYGEQSAINLQPLIAVC